MHRLKGRPTVFVARPGDRGAPPGATQGPVPWHRRDGDRSTFVAAVFGADGPLLTAVSESEELCRFRVAAYVAERIDTRLWPVHAARVRALLDVGDYAAAVSLYFEHVGERWDEEWLVAERADADAWTRGRGADRSDPDRSDPDRSTAA